MRSLHTTKCATATSFLTIRKARELVSICACEGSFARVLKMIFSPTRIRWNIYRNGTSIGTHLDKSTTAVGILRYTHDEQNRIAQSKTLQDDCCWAKLDVDQRVCTCLQLHSVYRRIPLHIACMDAWPRCLPERSPHLPQPHLRMKLACGKRGAVRAWGTRGHAT